MNKLNNHLHSRWENDKASEAIHGYIFKLVDIWHHVEEEGDAG